MLLRRFALLTCSFCLTFTVWGDVAKRPFSQAEFQRRRAELMRRVGPNLAAMAGASANETWRRFRQHNDFYYFTGLEAPNLYFILDGKAKKSYLFGPRAADLAKENGFDEGFPSNDFGDQLSQVARGHEKLYVSYARMELNAQSQDVFHGKSRFPGDERSSRESQFMEGLKGLAPDLAVSDMRNEIADMRRVKSAEEIAAMREAARVSALGCSEAIRACRPGKYEYELEAACEYAFMRNRATSAWTSIVASGPNINILHWMENNRKMEAGDYVLIDAGCDKDYYCADVTRTWPVSGKGTVEFRRVYNATLEAHKAMIAALKPGETINGLTKIMLAIFKKHGISGSGIAGHYVGMAPHDVGQWDKPFEPGVIFNVEPFAMMPDKNIHVRFEDSCLVTNTGCETLSKTKDLPWELDELIRLRDQGPTR